MPHSPAFIFDLDGTLVDTAPDLMATTNTLLAREGRRPVDHAELRRLVGRGARNLISEAFKLTGAAVDPAWLEALYEAFLKDYESHIADASRPIRAWWKRLRRLSGRRADGRLDQQAAWPVHPAAHGLNLNRFFGAVSGGGKRPWLKPDPRLFAEIVAELGARAP